VNQRPLCGLLLVCCLVAAALWLHHAWRPQPQAPTTPAPEVVPPPPRVVTVARPVQREVTNHDDFTGRTEASASVEVRPRVGGAIGKIHCRPGAAVKKGDRLFSLDERPFRAALRKAQALVKRREANAQKAGAAYRRVEKQREAKKARQKEVDKARDRLDKAEQALLSARTSLERARLELELVQTPAPIGGVVGELRVAEGGEVVGNGTVLTTLRVLDPMHVRFEVPRALRLRGELEGSPLLLGLAGEEGFPHRGSLAFVDSEPSSGGGLTVRGAFPNADGGIAPGRRAWVRLPRGKPYRALLVNESAVVREDRKDYLLVVNDRDVVEYRPVTLGPLGDGLRVVRHGLAANEWVAVSGLKRLQKGEMVQPRRGAMPMPAPKKRSEERREGVDGSRPAGE
jgi:multidrug efflux system membrane fusion protein